MLLALGLNLQYLDMFRSRFHTNLPLDFLSGEPRRLIPSLKWWHQWNLLPRHRRGLHCNETSVTGCNRYLFYLDFSSQTRQRSLFFLQILCQFFFPCTSICAGVFYVVIMLCTYYLYYCMHCLPCDWCKLLLISAMISMNHKNTAHSLH